MRQAVLPLMAAAGLGACTPVPGSDGAAGMPAAEQAASFDAALASIGCDLRFESDYLPVELQTGLTRAEVQALAATKVRRGEAAALEGGGVRSTVGACAPAATS